MAAIDALLALSTVVSGGTPSVVDVCSTTGRVLFVNVVLACTAVVLMALNNSEWFCCFLLFGAAVALSPSSVPLRFSDCWSDPDPIASDSITGQTNPVRGMKGGLCVLRTSSDVCSDESDVS